MKNLNIVFTDKEFKQLDEAYHNTKYNSWHDFILFTISKEVKHGN